MGFQKRSSKKLNRIGSICVYGKNDIKTLYFLFTFCVNRVQRRENRAKIDKPPKMALFCSFGPLGTYSAPYIRFESYTIRVLTMIMFSDSI